MRSIAIISEDKVGLLADISYVLAKSKINIDSINVAVVSKKAVICMEVSDPEKSKKVLTAAGYEIELHSLIVKLNLAEVGGLLEKLAHDGVTVETSKTIAKDDKHALVSLKVDKPKRASTILAEKLVTNEAY
ncbi:MAG: ACT domain-containing protein [Candidatus Micrarchaeota archaeon]